MGQKLSIPEARVLHFIHDFSLESVASAGTKKLGDLPDNFVIQSIRVQELVAVTATSTIQLGEDGGGDVDGYLTPTDITALGSVRGNGALVYDATAGDDHFIESVVDPTKDGLLMTVGTANAVAGKIIVYVQGYQMA